MKLTVKTAADIAAEAQEAMAAHARQVRDKRLQESDTEILRIYLAENLPVPQTWREYRQSLRDVPQQAMFPDYVVIPDRPYHEARNG